MVKIITICVFLIVRLKTPSCELYSSVAKIETLLQTQAHLINAMEESQRTVYKKERKAVKAFLANMKKDHAMFEQNPEHFLGNPINAVTLILRLYRDLKFVEKFLNETTSYKRDNSLVYPQKEDAIGAMFGIMRIQLMYDQEISQIADGFLVSTFSKSGHIFVENVTPMTASDCHDFSLIDYEKEDRSINIAWLEAAYRKYDTDRHLCSFKEEDLTAQIAAHHYFMKNWNLTIIWVKKSLALNADDYVLQSMLEQAKKQYDKERRNKTQLHQKRKKTISLPCKLNCQNKLTIETNASLFCYYAKGPHPFLILAPIKTELLYEKPYIGMFYDVITDEESEQLKTLAKPKLNRATVIDESYDSQSPSDNYIRQIFPAHVHNVALKKVLRRVHQFSGLQWDKFTNEVAQIANYGIGGYLDVHYDVPAKWAGEQKFWSHSPRLASTLIYMSDVEQGGATVFVKINLTIFPVKNAAIFWYNLDPWGNMDPQVHHAACPVLRGSKWVLTKSICMNGQEFTRPCPAHPPTNTGVNLLR